MDKILEQFQIQDMGCTDLACAVEYGKMLSVDRIIIGSVSLVGSTYIVIARIVDVESSKTVASVDQKQQGKIDNVIDLMPIVGHELLTGERLKVPVRSVLPQSTHESSSKSMIDIIGIKMVYIPAGSFRMGDIQGAGNKDELPVHNVQLDAFEMSAYEITQGQYKKLKKLTFSAFDEIDHPIDHVSWYDAAKFCNLLSIKNGLDKCYDEYTWECNYNNNGFRLPTEAEWEYACRAGTKTIFHSGNEYSDFEKVGINRSKTKQVGWKEPNAFGLYDMHGNVWEWCNDWYDKDYYLSSPKKNPIGPSSGSLRVIRGGGWDNNAWECRSATRSKFYPFRKSYSLGFRIVRKP